MQVALVEGVKLCNNSNPHNTPLKNFIIVDDNLQLGFLYCKVYSYML